MEARLVDSVLDAQGSAADRSEHSAAVSREASSPHVVTTQ